MPLLPSTLMGRWRRRTSPSSWRRWAFGTRLKEQGIRTRADQSDPILRSDPNLMVFGNLLTTSFFKPTNKNVIFPFEVVGCHRNFLLSKRFFLNRGFCDIKTLLFGNLFLLFDLDILFTSLQFLQSKDITKLLCKTLFSISSRAFQQLS